MDTQARGRFLRQQALQAGGILCAALVFFAALAAFVLPLAQAMSPLLSGGPSPSYGIGRLLRIGRYTFAEALASTALAVLAGIPAGFLVSRRTFPGRRLLASLSAVPLCVPPLIVALGYISTFGISGTVNRTLSSLAGRSDEPFSFLYSFAGLVMAQGFYNFPLVMASVADAWSQLDGSQADSARLLGAGEARCFFTITVFQLLPGILSGAVTVFLYCFFSFIFVLLFGIPGGTTFEVAIYRAGKVALDFRAAASLALLESGSAFLALLLLSRAEDAAKRLKGLSFAPSFRRPRPLGRRERLPAALFLLAICVCFILPLLSVAAASFTARTGGRKIPSLAAWRQLLSMRSFYRALANSLLTAACSGILCTAAGLTAALLLRHPALSGRAAFRAVPLLPMAVSSVIMALGMSHLAGRGHPAMLVLAQTALSWPLAYRQVHACLSRIPDGVAEAAALLSPSRTDALFNVILPSCRSGILSGMGFCFAASCADATLPLVLSIRGFDTLSLLTYRLAAGYRFPQASAAGTVLALVCALAFSLSNRAKEAHGLP